jgi:hypothetical protein
MLKRLSELEGHKMEMHKMEAARGEGFTRWRVQEVVGNWRIHLKEGAYDGG